MNFYISLNYFFQILTQSAGTIAADDMKIPKLIEKFFGELAKPPSTHSPSGITSSSHIV